MARTVPWKGARVIGISRRPPEDAEHLEFDLADPDSWPAVGESLRQELAGFDGERVVFVHAAGTVDPIGSAAEVDAEAYRANVLLNSAAPQALGQIFLAVTQDLAVERHLVMFTSGAAKTVYRGWTSYGAGKAAVEQWVRTAGAEQTAKGGVRVLAVAPGTVDTTMQQRLRESTDDSFPQRQKFLDLHASGKLSDPDEVAGRIWALLAQDLANGEVVDLRQLSDSSTSR